MSNTVFTEGYNYPIIRLPGSITTNNPNIGTLDDYKMILDLASKSGLCCIIPPGGNICFFVVSIISSNINMYRISSTGDAVNIIIAAFNTNNGVLNYTASSKTIQIST